MRDEVLRRNRQPVPRVRLFKGSRGGDAQGTRRRPLTETCDSSPSCAPPCQVLRNDGLALASTTQGRLRRRPPSMTAVPSRCSSAANPRTRTSTTTRAPSDAVGFRSSVEKPNLDDLDGHLVDRGGRIGRRRPPASRRLASDRRRAGPGSSWPAQGVDSGENGLLAGLVVIDPGAPDVLCGRAHHAVEEDRESGALGPGRIRLAPLRRILGHRCRFVTRGFHSRRQVAP